MCTNIKKIIKTKIVVIILLLLLILSMINFSLYYLLVPGSLSKTQVEIIETNLKIRDITNKLYRLDIIKYPKLFTLFAKLYSLKYPLKSGEYIFTAYISPIQVLKILSNGKSIIHKITVQEGAMVDEIIDRINNEPLLFGDIIHNVPEGFLMPATYFFSYGDRREKIITQMRDLMSNNIDNVMQKLPPTSPLKSRMDVLTLASIVEKETNLEREKPMVAAVFLNRLKKNMKLQADPTTIYAITRGKFKLTRPLTKKDLMIDSNYNTYYIHGLPLGPIACPSLKSLEAVVSPSDTKALYFVVNPAGGHHFSDNLIDHNRNVQNYRDSLKLNN